MQPQNSTNAAHTAIPEQLNLIWGLDAIAAAIGRSRSQTHHLLNIGAITPAKKLGGRWVVDRDQLEQFFRGERVA